MTPESAAADIVDRLNALAADSRENAQMVIQNLLRELVEQNRVPQYDLELRDCHEQIAMLNRQLIEAHAALSETCEWKQNVTHGYWEGTCGLAWEFTTGTPETNGFWCCPRCGRRVHTANAPHELPPTKSL